MKKLKTFSKVSQKTFSLVWNFRTRHDKIFDFYILWPTYFVITILNAIFFLPVLLIIIFHSYLTEYINKANLYAQ